MSKKILKKINCDDCYLDFMLYAYRYMFFDIIIEDGHTYVLMEVKNG